MYVARKAFRNYNQVVLPGSIVEPGSTKWFKTRLKDRVIIEINAHNFESWSEYFRVRYNVTLTNPEAACDEGINASASGMSADDTPADETKITRVVII